MNSFLLVDDDLIFNKVHAKTISLVDAEAEVVSYLSSREALEYILGLVESNKPLPKYIFIDINMPEMTGFEMIDRVLKQHPTAFNQSCCFILSSSLDDRDINRSKQYDFIKGFKGKPLTKDIIQEVLEG